MKILKTKRPSVSAEAPVRGSWQNPRSYHEPKNLHGSVRAKHPGVPASIYLAPGYVDPSTDVNPFDLFAHDADVIVEMDDAGAPRVIHTGDHR